MSDTTDDTYTTTAPSSSDGGGGSGEGGDNDGSSSGGGGGGGDGEAGGDGGSSSSSSEEDEDAVCHDRFNAERLRRSFQFQLPHTGRPFGHCVVNGGWCRKRGDAGHIDIDGGVQRPFQTCDTCDAKGRRMFVWGTRTANNRTFHRGTVDGLLWRADLRGAHDRGHLCRKCTRMEIRAYWDRRTLDHQSPTVAALTCTCVKKILEASGKLCLTHREELYVGIEDASERNAGPGGWLAWLYRRGGQARRTTPNRATVRAWRTNHNKIQNACRCGEHIHIMVAPFSASSNSAANNNFPVAFCTACNGVSVDINNAWVQRGAFDRQVWGPQGQRRSTRIARRRQNAPPIVQVRPNLDLGRQVPVMPF